MKNGRFSDTQIMAVVKQAKSVTRVSELCREHGMSSMRCADPTFHIDF